MDFNTLLDQKVGEVEAPKLMPIGTYTWEIVSRKFDKSTQKKTDYVEFTLKCIGHEDDVEVAELPEGWMGKTKTETFYLTPDALKRLEEWIKLTGIEEGLSLREAIETLGAGGHFVKGGLLHRPYMSRNNEPRIAVDFSMFAAVD